MLRLGPIIITKRRDRISHHNGTKQRAREEMASWSLEEIRKTISWTWEEIMAGDKSLPWKQAEAAKEGQRRGRGRRPQKPQSFFWGRHMKQSAKLRGESETVEELLDELEESERKGELETFEELLIKLEE